MGDQNKTVQKIKTKVCHSLWFIINLTYRYRWLQSGRCIMCRFQICCWYDLVVSEAKLTYLLTYLLHGAESFLRS